MQHIVIGLNTREAQGYATENLRGVPRIRLSSPEFAGTALRGVGENTTIHIMFRACRSRHYSELLRLVKVAELRGATIKNGD